MTGEKSVCHSASVKHVGASGGGKGTGNRASKSPSLSLIIFRTLFLLTFAVVLLVAAALITVSFATYENEARANLAREAKSVAAILDDASEPERNALLERQTTDSVRFTLIDPEGTVAFESGAPEAVHESHAERPEVRAAMQDGSSSVVRFSDTLQTDTIYAASKLSDGWVIRLSETRGSIFAFVIPMAGPAVASLVAIAALLALISRALTRKIMQPLEEIDLDSPVPGRTYAEMRPALDRIKKQQHQLKEQNLELQRAEGLRRDLSANVSHEMKTPLHVISGYAELMAAGEVPEERVREFSALIYDEAQEMRGLIDDVLVLSRLDEPVNACREHSEVDLHDVACEAVDRLQPLAQQKGIRVEVSGAQAVVEGDRALLEQLAANLISNAIRYNVEGGSVIVETRESDGFARLRVSDTGIGIPDGEQEQIFGRFYRVDKSRSRETGGTGLGLAIAKHAAMFHGGNIAVESSLGEGSTFEVSLPIART